VVALGVLENDVVANLEKIMGAALLACACVVLLALAYFIGMQGYKDYVKAQTYLEECRG
jgi:hypothetical protein